VEAEIVFLAVTLVGGENVDSVCLWKGGSQEHIIFFSYEYYYESLFVISQ